MGVDLILLPFYNEDMNSENYIMYFSQTVLSLCRRRELWGAIDRIEEQFGKVVPDGFMSYLSQEDGAEAHYGKTATNRYGNPLQFVLARHLKPLRDRHGVYDNWKNRAVWGYLEQLPDDLPIALYWC